MSTRSKSLDEIFNGTPSATDSLTAVVTKARMGLDDDAWLAIDPALRNRLEMNEATDRTLDGIRAYSQSPTVRADVFKAVSAQNPRLSERTLDAIVSQVIDALIPPSADEAAAAL